jgi:hypothetical protein
VVEGALLDAYSHLTAVQEKYWPALEAAVLDMWKKQAEQQMACPRNSFQLPSILFQSMMVLRIRVQKSEMRSYLSGSS